MHILLFGDPTGATGAGGRGGGGPAGVAAGRRTNTIAVTRRRRRESIAAIEGPPATVRRPACPAGQRRTAERCGAAARGRGKQEATIIFHRQEKKREDAIH